MLKGTRRTMRIRMMRKVIQERRKAHYIAPIPYYYPLNKLP